MHAPICARRPCQAIERASLVAHPLFVRLGSGSLQLVACSGIGRYVWSCVGDSSRSGGAVVDFAVDPQLVDRLPPLSGRFLHPLL